MSQHSPQEVGAYCVGQPSAVVLDGEVVVFYSSIGGINDPSDGPNPGRIIAASSSDGVHFTQRVAPLSQRPQRQDAKTIKMTHRGHTNPESTTNPSPSPSSWISNPNPRPNPQSNQTHHGGLGSRLGSNFENIPPPARDSTLYSQRDVDVRVDRTTGQFVLLQGDVGDTVVTWSLSDDGG